MIASCPFLILVSSMLLTQEDENVTHKEAKNSIPQFLPLDFIKMPTSRGLSAESSDVVRFLDTAHKARYVEISESQAVKTAESSKKNKLCFSHSRLSIRSMSSEMRK